MQALLAELDDAGLNEFDNEDALVLSESLRRKNRCLRLIRKRLLKHYMSYNMYTKPGRRFVLPPLIDPLNELSEYAFIMDTRFTKAQFRTILANLSLMPAQVRSPNRHVANMDLAVFVMLKRWSSILTFDQMATHFHRHPNWLCQICQATTTILVTKYCFVVNNLDFLRIKPLLEEWSESMHGAGMGTLDGLYFLDGKGHKFCAPGNGATAQQIAGELGVPVSMIQQGFYNGYYFCHGARLHSVLQCDAMMHTFVETIRMGDSRVYDESTMKLQIESLFVNDDPQRPVVAITDQAYARTAHCAPQYSCTVQRYGAVVSTRTTYSSTVLLMVLLVDLPVQLFITVYTVQYLLIGTAHSKIFNF